MEQLDIVKIAVKLYLLITLVTSKSSGAVVEPKQQLQDLNHQGLYNASDDVVILDNPNFKTSIYRSTKGWLVEFYNSWCGFCFRYAPTWKAFASDVFSWNDIVVIAAIDCAKDENNPICREYEIMHYPMLKYFSVNAHPPSLGIVIEKGEGIDAVRHNLVSRLEIEQQEGRGSSWPNIAPYRNVEITDIWKTASSGVKHFFLIFESTDSHLGTEVILDLHKIGSLQIRRVTSDNELLCVTNKVTKFPTLLVLTRNETQRVVNVRIPTRQGVRRTIVDYMIARGVNFVEASTIQMPRETQQTARNHQEQTTSRKRTGDHLYQLDLENALRYSLNHEISLTKLIDGEKLRALRKYLALLAAYFPLRRASLGAYLKTISDVVDKKSRMTGEEFGQLVKVTEERMSPVYSGPQRWIGCKGSRDSYRGYPCGLWTMFHALTVNFALERSKADFQITRDDPTLVLSTMHGYIANFFGCDDCARHFVKMVDGKFEARARDESLLWLWQAHNRVNARLSGDETEDPEHKKMQYPVAEHCPACWLANGSWNEEVVLQYLKRKYSYSGIKYDGVDKDDVAVSESKVVSGWSATEAKRPTSGEDLNGFDFSIWLVLYIASSVIFMLVCSKELRNYKRRMVLQDEVYKRRKIQLNQLKLAKV